MSQAVLDRALRLDLGCGERREEGFVRVDLMPRCEPDVLCDLEAFPWPFEDDSVAEIRLHHVLEHLGRTTDVFLSVIKELHRICRDGATIDIRVPHPRHDAYLTDPTHVRPILLGTLGMFSKRQNHAWLQAGHANSPLALHLDVDFEIVDQQLILDPRWQDALDRGEVDRATLEDAVRSRFNVVEEIRATLHVHKDGPLALARRCFEAGDAASCIDLCLRQAEVSPEDADLWMLLGMAMCEQGQLDGAELGFRRSLALGPNRASTWGALAHVLRQKGDLRGALEHSTQGLGVDPEDPPLRSEHANLLSALGRYDEAVEVSRRLVADRPDTVGFRSNLGNHLRQARRPATAVEQLRIAAAARPHDASIAWNLAMALFQDDRLAEGFRASEARYRRPTVPTPDWVDRMWDG
ncbi:MAG: tetratricopeptide repeat protein, partial [Myxococcota bacterium]